MLAILFGLGSALLWGASTVSSSRSSRMIGAASVLAWVMLVGFVVAAVPAAFALRDVELSAASVGWLVVSGIGNLLGLLLEYAALARGKVGIVASIASTEGALTAAVSALAGERIEPVTALLLALIASGVALAALAPEHSSADGVRQSPISTLLAVGAALTFAASLYATGRVSLDVPIAVLLLPARLLGVVALAIPLAVVSRLRLTRRATPLVLLSGVCEIAGLALFSTGARHGIAVAAVLASQFAAVAALGAFVLFRERLTKLQLAGVVAIVAGVATLAAFSAG